MEGSEIHQWMCCIQLRKVMKITGEIEHQIHIYCGTMY